MKRVRKILAAIVAVGMTVLCSSCTWNGLKMLRQEEAGIIVYNGVKYIRAWKVAGSPYYFPFQASSNVSGKEIGYIPVYNLGNKAVIEQYNENILIERYGLGLDLWLREGYPEFSAIEDYTIKNIEKRDCHNVNGKYEITAKKMIGFDDSINYFDLVEKDSFLTLEELREKLSDFIKGGEYYFNLHGVEEIDLAIRLNVSNYNGILYLEYDQKTEETYKYLYTGFYKLKNEYVNLFQQLL